MSLSWKIGSLFKIPIRLHYSMVIIPILAWSWTEDKTPVAIFLALILAVFLFGSVLLHELGHALTGRRFGIRTVDIILTPIGGMARIANMPERPAHEIIISLAGPIVSIALAGVFFGLTITSPLLFPFLPMGVLEEFYSLLFTVSIINLGLGLFNLVPALPMDGGRILRGLLSLKYNDHLKATQVASKLGKILAVIGIIVGILYFKSWSLVLISVFVFISAGTELRMAQLREAQRKASSGEGPFEGGPGPFPGGRKVYSWNWGGKGPGPYNAPGTNWSDRRPDVHSDQGEGPVKIEGGKAEVISRKEPE